MHGPDRLGGNALNAGPAKIKKPRRNNPARLLFAEWRCRAKFCRWLCQRLLAHVTFADASH